MDKILNKVEYKVKDLTLSDWGRKEIKLAEAEMPGLMIFIIRTKKLRAY